MLKIYSAYPVSGGVYKTFELAGWRPLAFISGWLNFVASDPPGLSAMALSIASYLSYFTHHSPLVGKFIAAAFILLFMFIHIRSVEGGGKLLDIITTFKIIPFVILAGVAILLCPRRPSRRACSSRRPRGYCRPHRRYFCHHLVL